MDLDDFNRPLGMPKPPRQDPPRTAPWRRLAVTALIVIGVGAAGYDRMQPHVLDGLLGRAPPAETTLAVAPPETAPSPAPQVSMTDVTGSTTPAAPQPRALAGDLEDASGVKVVRQGGGAAPGSMIIAVRPGAAASGLPPAPDRRLVEETPAGPLPRIGADGAKPLTVYARPPAPNAANAPRIALVIGGMGLNPQATASAIELLPEAVTLAFAPYGRNLAQQVAKSRERGHETILQAPMDGFGGEADEPGPNVLRTGAPAAETRTRLHWHMTRFTGYVGVAGYMGARFTADASALGLVMDELSRRGLFYFDDASSPRSLSTAAALRAGALLVKADVAIDARLDEIDGALARLEQIARNRGSAVGSGAGLPIVVEKAARFARGLEARGIHLVPASSLARAPEKPSARVQ